MSQNEPSISGGPMPIAVIGMGFRGPGEAKDLDSLWEMLEAKREAWSPVPKDRWNNEAFYHPDPNRMGTINILGGHFMQHDFAKFDAPFFAMTRAEAEALDPQQRLLLECSHEALENAGISMAKVAGSKTSCFIGSFCGDYTDHLTRDPDTIPFYQSITSGHSRALVANRLSYFFNLKGPSVTIDTACSASMVALHLACQSLRSGESNQALAGGVSVILGPDPMISMSMMRFMSPEGRCYSFDERAHGYARGEGVGCVILKPLCDALRDGDPIRCIIRNTGSNQDGRTPGITLPSGEAQEQLIRSVYAEAKLDPTCAMFVECHGTGTTAGDPIEASAIANVFTNNRPDGSDPLRIGSIKANIGHLEGASGIAGLIKAVLMLEKGKILPNRNFETPNKRIPFEQWKLKVPVDLEEFPAGKRIVSVNNFGYGGTNAHCILQDTRSFLDSIEKSNKWVHEDGTHYLSANKDVTTGYFPSMNDTTVKEHAGLLSEPHQLSTSPILRSHARPATRVFVLSAFDERSVLPSTSALTQFISRVVVENEDDFLHDLAHTLGERRTRFSFTVAVHSRSKLDLAASLRDAMLSVTPKPKNVALALVFTGQGAQWFAMGRELFARFPVFAQSIAAAATQLKALGADWDLKDELLKDAKCTRINEAIISQPACTALQIAVVDLLHSWNVKPVAVTGHSSGEIAAAYCAGALLAKDAMELAYHRGMVSQLVKSQCPSAGAMMAVGMSQVAIRPLLAQLRKGRAVIACINSAQSLTVSGDEDAVDELRAILDVREIFCRRLAVNVAYHSHHMEYVAEDYLRAIEHIRPVNDAGTDCAFYSSVTGHQISTNELVPQYWVDNMLKQVNFEAALKQMYHGPVSASSEDERKADTRNRISVLCEVGPHATLAGPIRQVLSDRTDHLDQEIDIPVLSCLVRSKNAEDTIAGIISAFITLGLDINLSAFNASASPSRSPRVLSSLPAYSWSHSDSFWAESRLSREYRLRPYVRNDLLGVPMALFNPSEPRWRNIIRISEQPWIKDHKVLGNIVYPGAAFLAMVIEAVEQQALARSAPLRSVELQEVTIGQALVISDDNGEAEVILSMRPFSDSVRSPSGVWNEFTISSVSPDNRWTEHCRGMVRPVSILQPNQVSTASQVNTEQLRTSELLKRVESRATNSVSPEKFYGLLSGLGLEYGPTFTNVRTIRGGMQSAVSSIRIADTASIMPHAFEYPFRIHPSTLDSVFQTLFAAIAGGNWKDISNPFMPVFLDHLHFDMKMTKQSGAVLSVWAETEANDDRQTTASIVVCDRSSSTTEPILHIKGMKCMRIARDKETTHSQQDEGRVEAYQTNWLVDVDNLSSEQFTSTCHDLIPDVEEDDRVEALEKAGFMLMSHAFPLISHKDLDRALPHHKRLYNCMKTRLDSHRDKYSPRIPTNPTAAHEFLENVRRSGAEGDLLVHIGKNLVPIIRQEHEALELMLEEGRLERYYRNNPRFNRNCMQAARYLRLMGHKSPSMSICEIGAGTGSGTMPILRCLTDKDTGLCQFGSFTFTDISTGFFEEAKEKLSEWSKLLTYAKLDIEVDPLDQGFQAEAYDVVIAANVLHATKSMKRTMNNVRKLLKPGGKLVLVELTRESFTTSTVFGTLPGWFAGEEEDRTHGPSLTEEKWNELLRETGFNGLEFAMPDGTIEEHRQGSMMVATASDLNSVSRQALNMGGSNFLIVHEENSSELVSVEYLSQWLYDSGVKRVTTGCLSTCEPAGKTCIVLSDLSGSHHWSSGEYFEQIKAILTTAVSVLWVTKGALIDPIDPTANMVTGFVRTARVEYGNKDILTLNLDPTTATAGGAKTGIKAIQALVAGYMLKSDTWQRSGLPREPDYEFAERGGQLLIPRLVPNKPVQKSLDALLDPSASEMVLFDNPDRPLYMEVRTPGLLDTIRFIDDHRIHGNLSPDAVEVSVKATGMVFKDIMMAMGQIPYESLGLECSGVILRIGSNVRDFAVGDRVCCYGPGMYARLVRPDTHACQRIPESMSFEMAAALPVNYITAYYSVFTVAGLQKGQSVLIHAASGGLGQALIELCQIQEAEIFCTVGTSHKKRLLMTHYSIPEDHIFTSRDTSFAAALKSITGGRGVDVIMNSVAGEMLRVTWDCIAPFGTFVELGARDYTINTRLEMSKFADNVTFTGCNLITLVRQRPQVASKIWADVMTFFRENKLRGPSPLTTYNVSDLEPALRLMQSGKHMGKLVITHEPNDLVKATPQILRTKAFPFGSDETYLLVGGMGGLGRSIALWMLAQGARNFIFASRSGLDRTEARDLKVKLELQGAQVVVGKCDISKRVDLDRLMEQSSHLPPIKGVIQGALILQDRLLAKMEASDYQVVIDPKVEGTWNLHYLFQNNQLDFFVMLSSSVGITGNAGQAAYSASGTFQDSFAIYRRKLGLAASTIDLGVVTGAGYVAERPELEHKLVSRGFSATDEIHLMALLRAAIIAGSPLASDTADEGIQHAHIVTGLGTWHDGLMDTFDKPLFAHFRRQGQAKIVGDMPSKSGPMNIVHLRAHLKIAKDAAEATVLISNGLAAKISSLSMIPIEEITVDRPLAEFGMDSLVAVEMRNWVAKELDANMSVLELLANEAMETLCGKILARSRLVRF